MFGERAMYLPLEISPSHEKQTQPKMHEGIWLGAIERIEETIAGTEGGGIKYRAVNRFPEDRGWDGGLASTRPRATMGYGQWDQGRPHPYGNPRRRGADNTNTGE